jgi:hypothetical protein
VKVVTCPSALVLARGRRPGKVDAQSVWVLFPLASVSVVTFPKTPYLVVFWVRPSSTPARYPMDSVFTRRAWP